MHWNSILFQNYITFCQWLLGRWDWQNKFNLIARNSNSNICVQLAQRLINIPFKLIPRHPYFTFIKEITHKETIIVTSLEIIFLLWEKGVYEESLFHTLRNFWIIPKKKKKKKKGENYLWNINYRWIIVIAFLSEGTHVLQSVCSDLFTHLVELYIDDVLTKSHLSTVKHPRNQLACKEVKVELC